MAGLLRCLRLGGRNICNTKKLGFVGSHRPILSWSFFTTTTGTTTLPAEEGRLDEHHHIGGVLGNLGAAASEKQRDASKSTRVDGLAQFAAFAIGQAHNLNIYFERVVSAKVQLLDNGRLYSITMEALDSGSKKFFEVHVVDTIIESNSLFLKEWCELKSPPPGWTPAWTLWR
ncbi:uncharacterized protein LOC132271045 [Cornus florida]|uniref:uncharacterized protein LOC132271045 n=1 Tax=Cornus florida TaxID=4283 RepID=UPI0028A0A303|nr:uncharacterized protein LOC132271045 [Cornus florida]